jgi:hypothetical protein
VSDAADRKSSMITSHEIAGHGCCLPKQPPKRRLIRCQTGLCGCTGFNTKQCLRLGREGSVNVQMRKEAGMTNVGKGGGQSIESTRVETMIEKYKV